MNARLEQLEVRLTELQRKKTQSLDGVVESVLFG
jgi:hypothetical protein